MTKEEVPCFKLDKDLTLEDPHFGQKLNSLQYNYSKAKTTPFPSDYTLAIFSNLAYQSKYQSLPDDWELLTTATNTHLNNGYFGVAFWNPVLCQVVVAHRGTNIFTFGALISDVQLGFSNTFYTKQSQSAASFVYLVSEQIKKQNNSNIDYRFQLSITGHSLGAWLAQITTFSVKYLKLENNKFVEDENYLDNIHAHTVVFESPGCREALSKLTHRLVPRYIHRRFANFNNLDMTVYLSQLNPINSVHRHVGTIYMVRSQTHSVKEIVELFNPETHAIERQVVLDFKSGVFASGRLLLKYLLPSSWMKQNVELKPATDTECSLNVFTEDELEFVNDWNFVLKRYSMNAIKYKEEKCIPEFKVNREYNLIESTDLCNLNQAIACIKYLRPTKSTILDLLESDVHDQVHLEIFKLEARHFQETVLKFHRYHFKDHYGLKRHLQSNDQNLLHIHVDSSSTLQCELETSIINNILRFYKKNDSTILDSYFVADDDSFVIVNWNIVYKAKNFLSKIIGNTKDKINLLIVECFEVYGKDEHTVLQSLLKSGAKVILVSTEIFPWLQENNIQSIHGFGNNIRFEDLTEASQKEFINQQNLLSLYGKTISLNDILDDEHFQNKKVYTYLNKTVLTLLKFMLTPVTGPVIMDCPYSSLLYNVVFLELYHEIDVQQFLSRDYNNEQMLFLIEDKEGLDILQGVHKVNLRVQSSVILEDECMLNFNKIIYFFKVNDGKLYLVKIFNKDFYIPRCIIHNQEVDQVIFHSSNSDTDLYFFYGDVVKYNYLYKDMNRKRKRYYHFVKSENEGMSKLKSLEKQETGHLFKISHDKIEWMHSSGTLNSLRKYMKPNQDSFDETRITDHRQITILSGEPGMGKSSTVGRLFLTFKQTHWVFAVPLRNSNFDDILNEQMNFDLIAKFILKSCNASDVDCLQYLLSYCLSNKTKLTVYLMFDGFDEIPSYEKRDKFVELVNYLKENSTVKILITTRKFACKALENGLLTFSSNYEIIDYNTKVLNFFLLFQHTQWRLFKPNISINEIRIGEILESAQNIFGDTITTFIGIPMQMRMMAEVLTPPEPYTVLEMTLMDILGLYHKYTENYYQIYFRRSGVPNNATINEWLSECIFTKLCKLAVIKLFNLDNNNYIKQNDINELNKVGLIQSDHEHTNINFEFLHDSVRDLLIAQILKLWLEYQSVAIHQKWNLENFIVSDFLIDENYKEVRFFLNCYLKNSDISEDRLKVCYIKLKELMKEKRDILLNIDNQESVFHVCVDENLSYLLKYFLLKIVDGSNIKKLLSIRNLELKTPLYMALDKTNDNLNNKDDILLILLEELDKHDVFDIRAVLLATFFTSNGKPEDIEKIKKHSISYSNVIKEVNILKENFKYVKLFIEACTVNNLEEVTEILHKFETDKITRNYLLLATNERRETCLHLTSNKKIAEKLLDFECDINAQDNNGTTPLNRAIKNGETDIAIQLINKGAQNIPDYFGFSALLHATKHGNLKVLELLHSKGLIKNGVDKPNIFGVTALMMAAKYGKENATKYLLEKGADPSIADKHGMTPIHYAAKGNCIKLISLFRQKDADINAKNLNGLTPLLYSIMRNQNNVITCLLNNGADVNIGSKETGFPLQLLIERNEKAIIKRILKPEEIKIKGGGSIIRAAADTDILKPDEIKYIRDNHLQDA